MARIFSLKRRPNPLVFGDDVFEDIENQARARHHRPVKNGAIGDVLERALFESNPEHVAGDGGMQLRYKGIPWLNSVTVLIPLAVIIGLQFWKKIGAISTLLLLSTALALALRPPQTLLKYVKVTSRWALFGILLAYLLLTICATAAVLLISLVTCYHCTCTWTG